MSDTERNLWSYFAAPIEEQLGAEDDRTLWQFAVTSILTETDAETIGYAGKDCIIAEIGRCSHWIRPHWKTRSGTRAPIGYGNVGQGYSFRSLPEFDWSLRWVRNHDSGTWSLITGQPTRRPLVHRITIPARSSRHLQATVHTIWTPGSPSDPKNKLELVYGFERRDDTWKCFTSWEWPTDRIGPKCRA